jgi:hypothetical protein
LSFRTIALTGQVAPDSGGQTFVSFADPYAADGGRILFNAELSGSSATTNDGLWLFGSTSPPSLTALARVGNPAPGVPGGTFMRIGDSSVGVFQPRVTFTATTSGGAGAGVWTGEAGNLALLAARGAPAPGVGDGSTFADFFDPRHTDFGSAFRADLANAPAGRSSGIWVGKAGSVQLLARTGEPAPGAGGATFASLRWPMMQAFDPPVTFFAGDLNTSTQSVPDQGIWYGQPGSVFLIHRSGQPAPGAEGALFDTFGIALPGGHLAFRATLRGLGVTPANDVAIFSGSATQPELVARTGAQAPGMPAGVTFAALGTPTNTPFAGTSLAYQAKLAGPGIDSASDDVVWFSDINRDTLVAREGQPAPGAADGATFASFERPGAGLSEAVFVATLGGGAVTVENDRGIWGYKFGRPQSLYLIAREGDLFEVAPGDVRRIEELHVRESMPFRAGPPAWFAVAGYVTFSADFTDGSSGVFAATLPDVPEPTGLPFVLYAFPLLARRRRRQQTGC